MVRYSKKKVPPPHVGISIPRSLAESVKPFLKNWGYVSLSDLARDQLREWLRTVAIEESKEAYEKPRVRPKGKTL